MTCAKCYITKHKFNECTAHECECPCWKEILTMEPNESRVKASKKMPKWFSPPQRIMKEIEFDQSW